MAKAHLGLAAVAALILLSSCGRNAAYVDVIQGNYYVSRGMYQKAVISYLAAVDTEPYGPWIAYNLGNVYNALGEMNAALDMWSKAEKSDDKELLFDVAYNRGLLYYGLGKYREAYDEFKHALEIDSSAIDAKINLEHALKKLTLSGGAPMQRKSRSSDGAKQPEDLERILDYVQNKEGRRWFTSDNAESTPATRDW